MKRILSGWGREEFLSLRIITFQWKFRNYKIDVPFSFFFFFRLLIPIEHENDLCVRVKRSTSSFSFILCNAQVRRCFMQKNKRGEEENEKHGIRKKEFLF